MSLLARLSLCVPVLWFMGCAEVVMMTNPLVTGTVAPNRVLHRDEEREQFREVAPNSLAHEAILVSADPQQLCFESTLRSLPDSDVPLDIRTGEILLNVDGQWLKSTPQITAEEPTTKTIPGMVPRRRTVRTLDCVGGHTSNGVCRDYGYRNHVRTSWHQGNLEVMESHARVCFPNHGATAATRKLRLDVNVPLKPADEQTLGDLMGGGAVLRLDFRWQFSANPPRGGSDNQPQQTPPVANVPPASDPGKSTDTPPAQDPGTKTAGTRLIGADLIDAANADGHFTTFIKMLQLTGLIDTLKSNGPYTVFAPTDQAFASMEEGAVDKLMAKKAKLTKLLRRHIVPGSYPVESFDKAGRSELRDLHGKRLVVLADPGTDQLMVDEHGHCPKTPVATNNGLLYSSDSVLH